MFSATIAKRCCKTDFKIVALNSNLHSCYLLCCSCVRCLCVNKYILRLCAHGCLAISLVGLCNEFGLHILCLVALKNKDITNYET